MINAFLFSLLINFNVALNKKIEFDLNTFIERQNHDNKNFVKHFVYVLNVISLDPSNNSFCYTISIIHRKPDLDEISPQYFIFHGKEIVLISNPNNYFLNEYFNQSFCPIDEKSKVVFYKKLAEFGHNSCDPGLVIDFSDTSELSLYFKCKYHFPKKYVK